MQEIRRIKRKDLDESKYAKALNDSLNYRIYAESWYLDVLTQSKWECLIYGDYEVIMPIPLQFKFGFKFVIQPPNCQQLGVFYKEEISNELFRKFEQKLHEYRVRSYHFNEENTEVYQPTGEKRINFVLDLNRPYEEISKLFRKDKLKNIEKAKDSNLSIDENFNYSIFKNLMDKFYSKISIPNYEFLHLLNSKQILIQYNLFHDEIINNSRYFLRSHNRIIVISSARNKDKKIDYSSYLIDKIIHSYSNSAFILDFEGSMIKGVAEFNKGFGAISKNYTVYSNNIFKL